MTTKHVLAKNAISVQIGWGKYDVIDGLNGKYGQRGTIKDTYTIFGIENSKKFTNSQLNYIMNYNSKKSFNFKSIVNINLGKGYDTVTIKDNVFMGRIKITDNEGNNTVNFDETYRVDYNRSLIPQFSQSVITLGGNNNTLNFTINEDSKMFATKIVGGQKSDDKLSLQFSNNSDNRTEDLNLDEATKAWDAYSKANSGIGNDIEERLQKQLNARTVEGFDKIEAPTILGGTLYSAKVKENLELFDLYTQSNGQSAGKYDVIALSYHKKEVLYIKLHDFDTTHTHNNAEAAAKALVAGLNASAEFDIKAYEAGHKHDIFL